MSILTLSFIVLFVTYFDCLCGLPNYIGTTKAGNKNKVGSFTLITNLDTSYHIPITKYRSSNTGLEVTFIDVDAPVVNGFFAVATEESGDLRDSGLPHTLEHLIFLGSEDYPYKGVLDTLANRSIARGTNAWTATDSTVYTITTAGSTGFKKIMPIFMDHILYPTLTDNGFVTEVYHIDGKGKDSGVVYSEMQGRENGHDDLSVNRMRQLMYPAPSGYSSETGGLMRKLREIDIHKIREFHKRYYQPSNLCLVITGKVDQTEILQQLEVTETKIKYKPQPPKLERPWINSPISMLHESVTEVVEFPEEDESKGNLMLAFPGPLVSDVIACIKIDILLMYLTDSSASLLARTFVDCDNPVATSVSQATEYFKQTSFGIYLSSVPTSELESLAPKVLQTLSTHVIDYERMKSIISLRRLRMLDSMEGDPAMSMATTVISHFLYGDRETAKDLQDFTDEEHIYDQLVAVTCAEWQALLKSAFDNVPHIILKVKPSSKLSEDITSAEAARVAEREKDPSMLEHYKTVLEAAMKANNMPIPPNVISAYEVPQLNVDLSKVESAQLPPGRYNSDLQRSAELADIHLPFFVVMNQVHSEFVGISLVLDTVDVPKDLRMYLNLWLELIFASPVRLANGQLLSHGLSQDTVSFYSGCGGVNCSMGSSFSCGPFESQVLLSMRVTVDKYVKVVEWMHLVTKNIQFDFALISNILTNLLGNIPDYKRDATRMARWTINNIIYDTDTSNHAAMSMPSQERFLTSLKTRVDEKDNTVIGDLKRLHQMLLQPHHIRLHLTGAISKVGVPVILSAWKDLVDGPANPNMDPALPASKFLNAAGQNLNSMDGNAKLINIPCNESGYFNAVARGVEGNDHSDYPAIAVALEYFSTMEGPFWKDIRGAGLAYGASISCDSTTSLITMNIYRAANVVEAYIRAKSIVLGISSGTKQIEIDLFEAAKASTIYNFVSKEETPRNSATQSFLSNTLQHRESLKFNESLIQLVQRVSVDDVLRVIKKYLPKLFDPQSSLMVCVSGPSKIEETRKGFADLGIKFGVALDE